jgi:gluconate 2-dehydrogenase gamma chain
MDRQGVTRRLALRLGLMTSAAAALLPRRSLAEALKQRLPWAPGAADRPGRIDARPGYLFFTADEAVFVEAAAGRLIPDDATGPGAKEAGVPRFIDRQLAGPYGAGDHFYLASPMPKGTSTQGWQMGAPATVYRDAIMQVNRWTADAYGKAFADLGADDQDEALKALESGDAALKGGVDGKAFFTLLLQNVTEGYFADPIYGGNRDMGAWRMIGFPGARYDYRAFVLRHNEPYPLPPVALMGRREWSGR